MLLMGILFGGAIEMLALFVQWVLCMGFFLTPIVNRLEIDEQGFELVYSAWKTPPAI